MKTGHSRRRRILLVVTLVLVVAVAVFALLWSRKTARPVRVDEALRKFHATSTSTATTVALLLRPSPGVYEYTGSGTERLSAPPKSQDQGPQLPATVTHGTDGCWAFRIDYSTNHWQTWDYCSRDGSLVEEGGQTFQRWDFVVTTIENLSTFHCDPPSVTVRADMKPGDSWQQSCTGTNTQVSGSVTSAGRYTFTGEEKIDVGGQPVAAYHFRQDRSLSGNQKGVQTAELWFAKDNGLPLRNERKNSVDTDSPIGTITYTESGTFTLTTMTPRT